MATKLWAICLIVLSTFFTATGQFFFKLGAERLPANLLDVAALLTNWQLEVGLVFYAVAFALLILALRGGELSVLYPFVSLGFVWVAVVSVFILGEPFSVLKALGIAGIIIGVSCIGWGSRESPA